MRKACVLVLLIFLTQFPINASAIQIGWEWANAFTDNRLRANGDQSFGFIVDFGIDTQVDSAIFRYANNHSIYYDLYDWGSDTFGYHEYGRSYPGDLSDFKDAFEGFDFEYVVSSSSLDIENPAYQFHIPVDSLFAMPLIDDATITGGMHPTVTWDAVGAANEYRFRLMDPDSGMVFNESIEAVEGQGTYSYTYTGDLFSHYDELLIRMEARDYIYPGPEGSLRLMLNRSRVEYAHSAPVPEPSTMILLGTGLAGLLGFGRKKFLKK